MSIPDLTSLSNSSQSQTCSPSLRKSILREPLSSGSHLLGALAAIYGAFYLIRCCDGSSDSVITVLVYSLATVILFSISGLLHGLHCSDSTISTLERLDYAAIYLFIAGTYTPVCIYGIGGAFGSGLLIGIWSLAVLGIYLSLTRGASRSNLQIAIYLIMGWAFLLALPSLSKALSPLAFNLLMLGGILYSVGAVVFAINWPSIFRSRVSAHDLWHLMVLMGSASHYALVVQVIS